MSEFVCKEIKDADLFHTRDDADMWCAKWLPTGMLGFVVVYNKDFAICVYKPRGNNDLITGVQMFEQIGWVCDPR